MVFVGGVFFGKQAAEYRFETRAEFGNLRRTQIDGEEQADAEQGINQQVVPQHQIDRAHQRRQHLFHRQYLEKRLETSS